MKVSEMTNEELLKNFSNLQSDNLAWNISKEIYLEKYPEYYSELLRRLNAEPAKPRCPKCGDLDIDLQYCGDGFKSAKCRNCGCVGFHGDTRKDFAQFFPAERQEGWVTLVQLVRDSHEPLWSAVSKLESQICRNPDLPEAYRTIMSNAFEWLRRLDKASALPAPPSAPAEPIAQKGLMAMQKNPVDKPVSDDV